VHVSTEVPPSPAECTSLPADNGVISDVEVPDEGVTSTDAQVVFVEAADRGHAVDQYEIRYREGKTMTEDTFGQATPAPTVVPSQPGQRRTVKLMNLKPSTDYTVGVRVRGGCVNQGPLAMASFTTKKLNFVQLSGCFVATAAYGSPLAPQVSALRRARDQLRRRTPFAAAAVGLYERASPPVASVLRESESGRAVVRQALSPLMSLVEAAERLTGR
jgi:hypothetical protein